MTTDLQGKVALVTGGSRGIGKAIASMLAAEGVRLAICGREEEALKRAMEEIQIQTHADIIAVKANLTRLNDIRRFVEAAAKKFNRVDILVNNAGGAHVGGITATTDETWEYHISLKLLGYIRTAREVIPHMRAAGGGKIINIVGTAGREPAPLMMVPGVTNGALLNFTKSLSKELEKLNIRVNSINPGTTDTPLTEETFRQLGEIFHKSVQEVRASAVELAPQGRLATPEDVAKAVLFLASDLSNFVNGIALNVDAGKLAGLW
ncbi:MAG TPA: glucose 1-dehydrogenase [Bacteroidota bacterium]|nr:glucose 1-dehydrogenase [Bacteroidota bacterium]